MERLPVVRLRVYEFDMELILVVFTMQLCPVRCHFLDCFPLLLHPFYTPRAVLRVGPLEFVVVLLLDGELAFVDSASIMLNQVLSLLLVGSTVHPWHVDLPTLCQPV